MMMKFLPSKDPNLKRIILIHRSTQIAIEQRKCINDIARYKVILQEVFEENFSSVILLKIYINLAFFWEACIYII